MNSLHSRYRTSAWRFSFDFPSFEGLWLSDSWLRVCTCPGESRRHRLGGRTVLRFHGMHAPRCDRREECAVDITGRAEEHERIQDVLNGKREATASLQLTGVARDAASESFCFRRQAPCDCRARDGCGCIDGRCRAGICERGESRSPVARSTRHDSLVNPAGTERQPCGRCTEFGTDWDACFAP